MSIYRLFVPYKFLAVSSPVAFKQFSSVMEKDRETLREMVSAVFAGNAYRDPLMRKTVSLQQDNHTASRKPRADGREKAVLLWTPGCVSKACLCQG